MSSGSPASALYEGTVWHERRTPVERRFSMRVWLPYLDLEELPELMADLPLLDERPFRPLRFRRSDHHGDPSVPLLDAVRATVGAHTGDHLDGPVRMLAHLRTWGWCFNPLTLYYCHGADGSLRHVLAEVTNTPWKERHAYVLPAGSEGVVGHEAPKLLHVSPLWPMTQRYRFLVSPPGDELRLRIENVAEDGPEAGTVVHVAGLTLRRRAITNTALGRLLLRHPFLTHRVSAGIHVQAAMLVARGARFHPHPRRRAQEPLR